MARGFDWLNGMIYGLRAVVDESTELTATDTIRFTGGGVTATYDEGNGWISVSIPGVDASLSWTSVATVAASATSPLVMGGSQWVTAHHVRTGATPATTKGQLRATDGEIIAAKIDGADEVVLQTDGSTIQIGDDFGPIIERPADLENWYVQDTSGVRLVASPVAVGVNRRLFLYGGTATTATAKGHVGLDSTGRLTVFADGAQKTVLVAGDVSSGVTSVSGTAPIASSGGATPAISISAASGGAAGSMSAAHFSLVDGATDAATVSTIVKRDAAGRFKAVAGVASDDVAVVSQLGGALTELYVADYASGTCTPSTDIDGTGNGAYVIEGETWTAAHMAQAAALDVDATGITGKATNAGSSLPVLYTTVHALAGVTVADRPTVVVQARIIRSTVGADADCSCTLMLGEEVYNTAIDQPSACGVINLNTSVAGLAVGYGAACNGGGGGGSNWNTSVGADMALAIALSDSGRTITLYALVWPGSWPDIADMYQLPTYRLTPNATTDVWKPKDLSVALRWSNSGNTTNVWSVAGLRVLA